MKGRDSDSEERTWLGASVSMFGVLAGAFLVVGGVRAGDVSIGGDVTVNTSVNENAVNTVGEGGVSVECVATVGEDVEVDGNVTINGRSDAFGCSCLGDSCAEEAGEAGEAGKQ